MWQRDCDRDGAAATCAGVGARKSRSQWRSHAYLVCVLPHGIARKEIWVINEQSTDYLLIIGFDQCVIDDEKFYSQSITRRYHWLFIDATDYSSITHLLLQTGQILEDSIF